MIFVIAPLVKGQATRRFYCQLALYSAALVVASATAFASFALLGHFLSLGGTTAVWIALGIVLIIYSGHEVGMLQLPVPTSRFVLPREWMRFPTSFGPVVYGLSMGLGFATRAPYAAYHAVVLATVLGGSVASGVATGLAFAFGRLMAPYAALIAIQAGFAHPVRLNGWIKTHRPLARLLSAAALAMLAGSIATWIARPMP